MIAFTLIARHEMILLTQADVDGELTASEAIAVATHRETCAECKAAYRFAHAARAAVRTLGTRHVMPPQVWRAVISRHWQGNK